MMMRLASYLSAPLLEILHDKTSLPQLISSATHLKDTSLIITQMYLTWEVLKCKTGGSTTIRSFKSKRQILCFHSRLKMLVKKYKKVLFVLTIFLPITFSLIWRGPQPLLEILGQLAQKIISPE